MLADQPILNLPRLALKMRDLLPEYSGIYYILDDNQVIWYIGKAKNIHKRWQGKSHHRIYQLETQKKLSFYIYYEEVSITNLDQKEKEQIEKYKPHLNSSPVKPKQVRPVESLLRETISAISKFSFIVGFVENQNSHLNLKNTIYICVDEEALEATYNIQSLEEKFAIIANLFSSRKIYTGKWEIIDGRLRMGLFILKMDLYQNSIIINYWNRWRLKLDQRELRQYQETFLCTESIRALTSDSLEKIQLIIKEVQDFGSHFNNVPNIKPYTVDLIKPLFKHEIDKENLNKKITKISSDYQNGKRGVGSRNTLSQPQNLEEFAIIKGINIQESNDQFRYYRGDKISIFVRTFNFDLKQNIIRDIINDNNYRVINPSKIEVVYLMTGIKKQEWLFFKEYFEGFVKLFGTLDEKEGFVEKLHVSPRKFIVPAKANIKSESIAYNTWIPFGFNPDFPTFEEATQEIKRRFQNSDLPYLKLTFKRESISQ